MRSSHLRSALLLLGLLAPPLRAADGDPDPTFWFGGQIFLGGLTNHWVNSAVAAPDERFVVVGSHEIAGGNEWFWFIASRNSISPFCYFLPLGGATSGGATAAAFNDSGSLLIAGSATYGSSRMAAALFDYPNCALDNSLDGDGFWTLDIPGGTEWVEDVAISELGQIAFAGYYSDASDSDFAVALTSSSGALLSTFSGDGWLLLDPSGSGLDDSAAAIAFDDQGRIVVGGTTSYGVDGDDADWTVARFTPEGDLDDTFDGDGLARVAFNLELGAFQRDYLHAMVIDPNGGEIVLAGRAQSDNSYDSALARLLPSGAPDPSFSGDGKLNTSFNSATSHLLSVAVDGLGRVYAAGMRSPASGDADFVALRTTAGGILDPSFSTDGWTTRAFNIAPQYIDDLGTAAVFDGGRWAVAGNAEVAAGQSYRPALVRLDVSLIFADGVESGGIGQWSSAAGAP